MLLLSLCYSVRNWVQNGNKTTQECQKVTWKHRGCENCRSPPVSILRLLFPGFSISGLCAERQFCMPEGRSDQQCENSLNTRPRAHGPAHYQHLPSLPHRTAALFSPLSATIGWPEQERGLCATGCTIGIYRGLSLRLSDLSVFLPGETE